MNENLQDTTKATAKTPGKDLATKSLWLGVASLLCFSLFTGIPGWIMAVKAKRALRAAGQATATATIGHVLSIIGTLLMPFVVTLSLLFADGTVAQNSQETSGKQASQSEEVDYNISVMELWSDYQKNIEVAQAKYEGKRVCLTGVTLFIKPEEDRLSLTPDAFKPVPLAGATFRENDKKSWFPLLRESQEVTFIGTVTGTEGLVRVVKLKDCFFPVASQTALRLSDEKYKKWKKAAADNSSCKLIDVAIDVVTQKGGNVGHVIKADITIQPSSVWKWSYVYDCGRYISTVLRKVHKRDLLDDGSIAFIFSASFDSKDKYGNEEKITRDVINVLYYGSDLAKVNWDKIDDPALFDLASGVEGLNPDGKAILIGYAEDKAAGVTPNLRRLIIQQM